MYREVIRSIEVSRLFHCCFIYIHSNATIRFNLTTMPAQELENSPKGSRGHTRLIDSLT